MSTDDLTRSAADPTLIADESADLPYDPDATIAEAFVVDGVSAPVVERTSAPRHRRRWIAGAAVVLTLLLGLAVVAVATSGGDGADPANALVPLTSGLDEEGIGPGDDGSDAEEIDTDQAVTPATSLDPGGQTGDGGGTTAPGGEQPPPPPPDPDPPVVETSADPNLGLVGTNGIITIRNGGGAQLQWTARTNEGEPISLSANFGSSAPGEEAPISFVVDRNELGHGPFSLLVRVGGNGGSVDMYVTGVNPLVPEPADEIAP